MKNYINKILIIFSVCLASEFNLNLEFINKLNSTILNDKGLKYGLSLNGFYCNKKLDSAGSLKVYSISSFIEKDFNFEDKLSFFIRSSWYVLFVNHKISEGASKLYLSPFVTSVSFGAKYDIVSNLSLRFEIERFLTTPNELAASLPKSRNVLSLSLNFEF